MTYQEFLETKIELAQDSGFVAAPEKINQVLKPHQRDAVAWALKGGRRALFESFGLGKTVQELEFCHLATEHEKGRALIVLPLGVKQEFTRDAVEILGYERPTYCRTMDEVKACVSQIVLTNYERVRDGDIDPSYFVATSLDEASVLRSFGSKTYQTFLDKFKNVPYKLVATATPSPNKYKELIHYAGYLEVMDTGQALTRFFQRDSTKANHLTLYPNMEDEFWLWISSWSLFITKPSDLNPEYSDEGYDLPPLEVHWHEIPIHYGDAMEKDGQMQLFQEAAEGLKEAAQVKRESIDKRVETMKEIVDASVNRVTYGNITMFSPVLCEKDLFNSLDKMVVTADRIEDAFNTVRKIDYSLFYRPMLPRTGTSDLIKNEMVMEEILPDVILMPNAGTRAMMWQETASVRNDTPARFMIPIFTAVDLQEAILENCGRYRWEMCRKIQGVRWNDIRERSLTSDYYDYLQFYRKNRELSAETKDQIKGALTRAKNNFREVFVKDYQNWIKYEAKGGFRLNRYVRQIMFNYCPFSKAYRADLKTNPMFADAIGKLETNNARNYKRLQGLYEKYKREGGTITPELRENLNFYQM